MRYRQVHLDFHTSECVEGIGEKFNKKQFQNALKTGFIDSITIFSKCHHGWSYHPTKVNQMHPNLKFDLLRAQMEACKEIDVKAPVYLSAGFDENQAKLHPEWLCRQKDESLTESPDFFTPGFHHMCYNTGYLDLLLAEVQEVMEQYSPDGIFLDISSVHLCYCPKCRQDILKRGKDFREEAAVWEQAEITYANYTNKVEEIVRKYSDTCTIFHNGGHVVRGRRDLAYKNTHLELESLPTGGWGYDHFPMSASYVANLRLDYLGMTGKFHTSWGEFGGFKHPNALRYETGLSLAFGARCSIGDQMHPSGFLDEDTYKLIGTAYKEIKEKEKWCIDAVNCADIGILSEEAFNAYHSDCNVKCYGDIGANRIMLEGKYLYRLLDSKCDFSEYKVIILPDTIRVSKDLSKRLLEYLDNGGKILASGTSGLEQDRNEFALPFGAEFIGENTYKPDYLIPLYTDGTKGSAKVMYERGYRMKVTVGKVIGERQNSYFNRDILHFSSHRHTPNDLGSLEPGAVKTRNTIYIGWNIFSDYGRIGALHSKRLIINSLGYLLGQNKTLVAELPDRSVTTLTAQKKERRLIQHILFAHTTLRGEIFIGNEKKNIEVIEDIVPLYNVGMQLRCDKKIKGIRLVPQMIPVDFVQDSNLITYTVPKVECHQMVEIEY
ncbi:MAG: alpha-amylase family protein [Anaerocolumna sp.]